MNSPNPLMSGSRTRPCRDTFSPLAWGEAWLRDQLEGIRAKREIWGPSLQADANKKSAAFAAILDVIEEAGDTAAAAAAHEGVADALEIEVATLQSQVATLTAERDQLRRRLAEMGRVASAHRVAAAERNLLHDALRGLLGKLRQFSTLSTCPAPHIVAPRIEAINEGIEGLLRQVSK